MPPTPDDDDDDDDDDGVEHEAGHVNKKGKKDKKSKKSKKDTPHVVVINTHHVSPKGIPSRAAAVQAFLFPNGNDVPVEMQQASAYDQILFYDEDPQHAEEQLEKFRELIALGKAAAVETLHWGMDGPGYDAARTRFGDDTEQEAEHEIGHVAGKCRVVMIHTHRVNPHGIAFLSPSVQAYLLYGDDNDNDNDDNDNDVPIQMQGARADDQTLFYREDPKDAEEQLQVFHKLIQSGKAFPVEHSHWGMDRPSYTIACEMLLNDTDDADDV